MTVRDDAGTGPSLLELDAPGAADPGRTGNKAASLAVMRAAGLPVPDGLVLPVGLASWWHDPALASERAALVESTCARLPGMVAVRSSTTWEDGSTSAHAGETVTVLGVSGAQALARAVDACLDAAESRRGTGVGGDIAVLVQRMVPAEFAGVAFTADPLTGDRDVVRIGATSGLGDALVGGEVRGIDVKLRDLDSEPKLEGSTGVVGRHVLIEVARLARCVESIAGSPQDVEWAWAAGDVFLLQARAITALPVQPSLPDGTGWDKDVAHYPEQVSPFGFSVEQSTASAVTEVFVEVGMLIKGLDARLVGGEVYARAVPAFGEPGDAAPPPAWVLGILSRVVPSVRAVNRRARAALDENLFDRWVDEYEQRERTSFPARTAQLRRVVLTDMSDAALADHAEALTAHASVGAAVHFRLGLAGFHSLYQLHTLVRTAIGWDDAAIATMLVGHSPASRAGEIALAGIRDRVRASSGARAALAERPQDPVAALARVDASLAEDLQRWLDEHGWGCMNNDAGAPVLAERPGLATRLLLAAADPVDHASADEAAGRARAELPTELRAAFDAALGHARRVYAMREDNIAVITDPSFGLLHRWLGEAGVRVANSGALPRSEDAAYATLPELIGALRNVRCDPPLAASVVQRRGEEAYARMHPGPLRLGKASPPPDVRLMPRPLATMNAPILWAMGHEYPDAPEPSADSAVLAGVAAAPGVAEGPVRIVLSHADLQTLAHGDVLVCRVTSPAWAAVFPLAAAVVADGGGVLSHAAIAAREHGLPAVLGTGVATTVLRDGDRVRVDGGTGRVTVL